jgi:hypothetical protein
LRLPPVRDRLAAKEALTLPENCYYLHFNSAPAQELLAKLSSDGAKLIPVFETSYEVEAPFPMSHFKFLLKNDDSFSEVYIAKTKSRSIFRSSQPQDSGEDGT